MYKIFYIFLCSFIFIFTTITCGTAQKKDNIQTGENLIRNEKQKEIFDAANKEFETKLREKSEVFRVFVSSDFYQSRQMTADDTIKLKDDPGGKLNFSESLKNFNKIDWTSEATVKLELYPDTGKISRIRFVHPSGIGEIDKLVSDDITRWVFEFPRENIEPRIFTVSYFIILQNHVSRQEAIEELRKHVQQ